MIQPIYGSNEHKYQNSKPHVQQEKRKIKKLIQYLAKVITICKKISKTICLGQTSKSTNKYQKPNLTLAVDIMEDN